MTRRHGVAEKTQRKTQMQISPPRTRRGILPKSLHPRQNQAFLRPLGGELAFAFPLFLRASASNPAPHPRQNQASSAPSAHDPRDPITPPKVKLRSPVFPRRS